MINIIVIKPCLVCCICLRNAKLHITINYKRFFNLPYGPKSVFPKFSVTAHFYCFPPSIYLDRFRFLNWFSLFPLKNKNAIWTPMRKKGLCVIMYRPQDPMNFITFLCAVFGILPKCLPFYISHYIFINH